MIKSALLVLENGIQFYGRAMGVTSSAVGEVVFNTLVTGYQEILTNPFYSRQIATLTHPRIDNAGTNEADTESSRVHAQGLVIRNLSLIANNFRDTEDLSSYLKRHNIMATADTDTRKLIRLLREKGTQNGYVTVGDNLDAALALEKTRAFPGLNDMDLAREVATTEPYSWTQGNWTLADDLPKAKPAGEIPFHIVAYDLGTKCNILRMLVDRGCHLTVVLAEIPAEDALKMNPDGIFLPNGPGDPTPCDYVVTAIQKFLETDIPVFSIYLDHQLLALASGVRTIKMRFSHHSGNHPIKDTDNNTVMITVQNHGFTIDEALMPANLCVTHKSLFDSTLQGIHRTDEPVLSFQGHLEASPGPYDTVPLSDHSIELIK